MKIKGLIPEDFVNYKKASMTILFPTCTWKCGLGYCQNSSLARSPTIEINADRIIEMYINNPITEAVVMQGLEPLDSWLDVKEFVEKLRELCDDDIVIYTGYYQDEISEMLQYLSQFSNIIIKFGRYIPNHKKHYSEVLGVYLQSDNQYARNISLQTSTDD